MSSWHIYNHMRYKELSEVCNIISSEIGQRDFGQMLCDTNCQVTRILFYLPLCNDSMQCTNPMIFILSIVLIVDFMLTKSQVSVLGHCLWLYFVVEKPTKRSPTIGCGTNVHSLRQGINPTPVPTLLFIIVRVCVSVCVVYTRHYGPNNQASEVLVYDLIAFAFAHFTQSRRQINLLEK